LDLIPSSLTHQAAPDPSRVLYFTLSPISLIERNFPDASLISISFTINHIAAVVLPALLGIVWVINHSAVFLVGAGIAASSLLLSQLIPNDPRPSLETRLLNTSLTQ
jgi:hypothetical protein